ncbi:MAG: CoA pyrophosphatase [Spirochaetes bacterium]|nr:CoA pyrophosphatase [Spirochaetota bacterium]
MNLYFTNENYFTDFKKEIKRRLENREKLQVEKSGSVSAAVLMLLLNKNNEAHVFLTKRTQSVSNHKGQISFPGGAVEKIDRSFLDTALRETYEETGIKPGDIEIIGEFDEIISISDFHVHTFIGSIKYPYDYIINADEIEECFEAPLSIFYNKEYYKVEDYFFDGEHRKVYYYSYNGFEIWGMTASILTRFSSIILRNEEQ